MKKIIGLFIFMGLLSATTVQAQNYNTKCLGISAGYMFDTENVQAGVFMHLPLAGIAFQSWRGNALQNDKELSNTRNKFGINAGAGFEINISRHLNLHIEGKYIFINDFNQANISIGLGYKF